MTSAEVGVAYKKINVQATTERIWFTGTRVRLAAWIFLESGSFLCPRKAFRCNMSINMELFPKVKTWRYYGSSLAFLFHSKHPPNVFVQLSICKGCCEGKCWVIMATLVLTQSTWMSVALSKPLIRSGSTVTTWKNSEKTEQTGSRVQRTVMFKMNPEAHCTPLPHKCAWESMLTHTWYWHECVRKRHACDQYCPCLVFLLWIYPRFFKII